MNVLFHELPIPSLLWRREKDTIVLLEANTAAVTDAGEMLLSKNGALINEIFPDGSEAIVEIERAYADKVTTSKELSFRFLWRSERRLARVSTIPVSESDMVMVIEDRSSLQAAEAALILASRTDSLTGLVTRRVFREIVEYEYSRTRRYGRPYSIAFIDLDDYHTINEKQGQDFGDQVLVQIGDILRENLRDQDRIARWGCEVFAILFPEAEADEARLAAEKLRLAIEKMDGPMTVSIGIASNDGALDPEKTLIIAEKNLKKAKDNGKNCVVSG